MPPVSETASAIVPGLTFQLFHDNKVGVFGVNGNVSFLHLNRAVLRSMEAFLRHECHVVVDLTHARALHEARIGFLAYGQSFLRKMRRRFAIVAPRKASLFRKLPVDMDRVFSIYTSREDAVRAVLGGEE